jgi:hypothetical protein
MVLCSQRSFLAAATFTTLVLSLFSIFSPWFEEIFDANDDDLNSYHAYYFLAPAYLMADPSLLYADKNVYGSETYCPDGFNTDVNEDLKHFCQKIGASIVALSFSTVAALIAFTLSASALRCPSTVLFHAAGGFSIVSSLALIGAIAAFSSIDWADGATIRGGMGLIEAACALAVSSIAAVVGFILGCNWHKQRFRTLQNDTRFLTAPQVGQ